MQDYVNGEYSWNGSGVTSIRGDKEKYIFRNGSYAITSLEPSKCFAIICAIKWLSLAVDNKILLRAFFVICMDSQVLLNLLVWTAMSSYQKVDSFYYVSKNFVYMKLFIDLCEIFFIDVKTTIKNLTKEFLISLRIMGHHLASFLNLSICHPLQCYPCLFVLFF